ncbi:MAG TPA: hypothetical protein VK179_08685 [Bacteroidales bacterium]|nr:hypothetical protein [Bacteroidales bacterium]
MKIKFVDLYPFTIPVFLPILLFSCTHDPVTVADLDTVCFQTQVLPIIQTSCGMSGCHDGSQEGFLATDYSSIMEAVKPGDPRGSKLYKVITNVNGENFMPPDQPLTRLQRSLIEVWIQQGAKNTTCKSPTDTTTPPPVADEVCFVQDILPMMLSSCGVTGCHDAATHEEGKIYIDYTSIRKGVVANNPQSSQIYQVMNASGEDRMPPSPRPAMTAAQKDALRKWILAGAENTDCPPAVCDTAGTMSFTADVTPVLKANCTGCHNSSLASGNVNLSTYAGVDAVVKSQRNGTSVLQGSIKRLNGFTAMPPTFSLDDCSVATIDKWIAQGGLNN